MAAIHDLIARITDQTLRDRILQEWDAATRERKFGLVFENHLPECLPIYSATPRRNDHVALKNGPLNDLWLVRKVQDGQATCERPDRRGEAKIFPLGELLVVRPFGEPIFPTLVPMGQVQNGPADAPWHTLIEADNYHALQLLDYLYAGQVDCIYIDPPYNTGARDWKYNNDYEDGNDGWRDSKWLAFMERRLKLAKRLLNTASSVLIVTIDEKEYLRLGLLLEQTFPETAGTMQMVSIRINPSGVARGGEFRRSDEYAFFLRFGDQRAEPITLGEQWIIEQRRKNAQGPEWNKLRRTGTNTARSDRPNLFYPLFIDPKTGTLADVGEPLSLNESIHDVATPDGLLTVWPIRADGSEGNWQISPDSVRAANQKGYLRLGNRTKTGYAVYYLKSGEQRKVESGYFISSGRRPDGSLDLERGEGEEMGAVPSTQWVASSHDAATHGSRLLGSLLPGRRFPFPKSLYAVEDALRFFVANKPTALILDFFAGSGTTAHAVMRLNHQDGGLRRCISVTNNEVGADEQKALQEQGLQPGDPDWDKWGICRHVTFPRLAAAVTGRTPEGAPIKGDYKFVDEFSMSEGFPANLAYFKLDFLDRDRVALKQAFREILPLLWLKAGAKGPRPECTEGGLPGMFIPEGNTFAVLLKESALRALLAGLKGRSDLEHIFLVTDDPDAFKDMMAELNEHLRGANPNLAFTQLYRDYLENFLINRGDSEGSQA